MSDEALVIAKQIAEALEASLQLRISAWKSLDRDCAVEPRVTRFVHFTEATGTERQQEFVGTQTRRRR